MVGKADLKQVLAPYLPEWGWQAELYTDFEAFAERVKTWISQS